MSGGTFTISNGGVFGSLLSTPIINPPQSAVLGMHRIEERPVVKDGQIVARPMMYLALSYDHRIIDGREAVTFLVRVKEAIEDPTRLLDRPVGGADAGEGTNGARPLRAARRLRRTQEIVRRQLQQELPREVRRVLRQVSD